MASAQASKCSDPLCTQDFAQLTFVIKDLVTKYDKEKKQLRIWIAGCSTGQEAYSVAMVVAECMREHGNKIDVRILASDTKPAALAVARQGVYGEWVSQDYCFRSARDFIPSLHQVWQGKPGPGYSNC